MEDKNLPILWHESWKRRPMDMVALDEQGSRGKGLAGETLDIAHTSGDYTRRRKVSDPDVKI